ncbi:hypothetical protein GGP41_002304 [Bipolaris sorokiniana]|uniref:Uncharacterized protein n=1 Tax=Cochliobolus sativus TaxID=45130 RepID=A0A8H5ZJ17_COCSA|nr:hypothetical protein GGP41_002304 [Bipolaris sorokiniana]
MADGSDNINLVTADFDLDLEVEQDASVLVGDVMSWGQDQVVVVKPTLDDRTTVATYGQQSGSPGMVCMGLHQCDTALGSDLVGFLLTALVPFLPGSPLSIHMSNSQHGYRFNASDSIQV